MESLIAFLRSISLNMEEHLWVRQLQYYYLHILIGVFLIFVICRFAYTKKPKFSILAFGSFGIFLGTLAYYFVNLDTYYFTLWWDSLDFMAHIKGMYHNDILGYAVWDSEFGKMIARPAIDYPYWGFIALYKILSPFGYSLLGIFELNKFISLLIPLIASLSLYFLTRSWISSFLAFPFFMLFKEFFITSQTIFSNTPQLLFTILSFGLLFLYEKTGTKYDLFLLMLSLNILIMIRQEMIILFILIGIYLLIQKKIDFKKHAYFLYTQIILLYLFFMPLLHPNSKGNLCETCWTSQTFISNFSAGFSRTFGTFVPGLNIPGYFLVAFVIASIVLCLFIKDLRKYSLLTLSYILIYALFYFSWMDGYGTVFRYHVIYLWALIIPASLLLKKIPKRYNHVLVIVLLGFGLALFGSNRVAIVEAYDLDPLVSIPYTYECIDTKLSELPNLPISTVELQTMRPLEHMKQTHILDQSPDDFYFIDFDYTKLDPNIIPLRDDFITQVKDYSTIEVAKCTKEDIGDNPTVGNMTVRIYHFTSEQIVQDSDAEQDESFVTPSLQ